MRRVALALSLSCAVNLTALYSDPASAVALFAGYMIGCALLCDCDRELSGFLYFSHCLI